MTHLRLTLATAFAALCALTAIAHAEPVLPVFDPANFDARAEIDNPYFPLMPGLHNVLTAFGKDADGDAITERIEMFYAGDGPVIEGIASRILLDRAYEDALLVEETRDFFAQDRDGNVWYLGEDVTNFLYDANDQPIGTDSHSSWRAGVNGARPGYQMPADPAPGFTYFQENAPTEEAMDIGEILGTANSIEVPIGMFDDVLMVYETSPVDPALQEIKYYARGIGMVRADEGVDAAKANPALVFNLNQHEPQP